MSKALKGIGKAFRKVVKPLKKILLPALAIGAVVLTGGAALGVLPGITGIGGLVSSLGLSPALTGILTTAARGAAMGAAGSLLTGKSITKGATMGLVAGGITGGLGAAMGGASKVAQTAASTVGSTGADALQSSSPYGEVAQGTSFNDAFAPVAATPPNPLNLNTISSPASNFTGNSAASGFTASPQYALTDAATSGGLGGGLGAGLGLGSMFSGMDPTAKGMMIQGLGSGLMGAMAAKEQRKAQEREWDRMDANYDNLGPLFQSDGSGLAAAANLPDAGKYYGNKIFPIQYDPATAQIRRLA